MQPPAPSDSSLSERLTTIVARESMVDMSKLTPEASLTDLGVTSADVVVILIAIEEEFGIYISADADLNDVKTVDDLVRLVSKRIENAQPR